MAEQDEPLRNEREGDRQLPPVGVGVWVEYERCRIMAYRDSEGVWRSFDGGRELKGVTKVEWPDRWPEERW